MRPVLLLFATVLTALSLHAQSPDPAHRDWHASWITHPTAPLREPLVLHFRRALDLAAVPASYPVRVSADNRFILFVNGHRVGDGPARADLAHWRYERFDLAPFLRPGKNLIAATVWNFGVYAPVAQMSDRTAFLLESEASGESSISTPKDWLVEQDSGQRPLDRTSVTLQTYMAAGPGEQINAALYDWAWDDPASVGPYWVPAASPMRDSIYPNVNKAHSADSTDDNFWGLVPDTLPPMEFSPTDPGKTVRTQVLNAGPVQPHLEGFPAAPVTVPAGVHVHLLLDRKALTTAYPRLTVSGGQGAQIRFTYAEALFDKDKQKGDRDDVAGRTALGLTDSFLPDGGLHRSFEPLWWRTWRYLDLDIETAGEPLQLESLTANFTAYPFQERATFKSDDPDLDKIWEVSWRTARLDAHETYMDTPYYEQLQYVGDTRLQALISYTVAGDDRLAVQALQAFDQSRTPEGITRSRYPSSLPQSIPTFSLLYVGMVHDYWMYRPDPEPARALLPGTRTVLDWFSTQANPDGLLHAMPWWSFIDWVSKGKIPTYSARGESCATTLEYLGALIDAADLEKGLGDPLLASRYEARAAHVRSGLFSQCWSASRGLIADNPDQKNFSQQANVLAVLYDVVPKDRQQEVMRRMLAIEPGTTPDGVLSASYYFRFYLARALEHSGLSAEYLRSLDPWRKLLPLHFSTWPETPGETRSDSHAWTSHPIYDLLTLVAGIEPASPGFATVRIAPNLGALPSLTATYPHPQGEIKVEYQRHGSGLAATVTLPGKLTGVFVYNGKTWPLTPGLNKIQAP
ncbi:MAG: alpha-L-rhamnosidase C-terminal domain-containing protein [Terracidiphilus sp.]|nr:alpha-L-rhamnosidase C-terminal domain-containing protein [Terracidiphilus sp.]MDR3775631.1 alpha-L-rhamnosidase C-terminal domain-containing protein [Terracidiphilus sp.]